MATAVKDQGAPLREAGLRVTSPRLAVLAVVANHPHIAAEDVASRVRERLGAVSGSARSPEELVRMAASQDEFSVYTVEVCRTCSWNHLVQSYVLGAPVAAKAPRKRASTRRTASE